MAHKKSDSRYQKAKDFLEQHFPWKLSVVIGFGIILAIGIWQVIKIEVIKAFITDHYLWSLGLAISVFILMIKHLPISLARANAVRLIGPRDEDDKVRKEWVDIQVGRAHWINLLSILILIWSAILYMNNHLTANMEWQTHENRLNSIMIQEGYTLEDVADSLVNFNKNIILIVNGRQSSRLDSAITVGIVDSVTYISLNEATMQVNKPDSIAGVTSIDIARGFSHLPLKNDQILTVPRIHRTMDIRQWIDWLLWALIGVAAFIMKESAKWYREISKGEGDFLGETLWYYAQFVTGPVLAFMVLLTITQMTIALGQGDGGGSVIGIDFRNISPDLLIIPAFLLGFFSRVALKFLEQLMKKLFPAAWQAARGTFSVIIKNADKDDGVFQQKSKVLFATKPHTPVAWYAGLSSIDANSGELTAAEVDTATDDTVTAREIQSGILETRVIKIVPHKFKITIIGDRFSPGSEIGISIDPPPPQVDKLKTMMTVHSSSTDFVQQPQLIKSEDTTSTYTIPTVPEGTRITYRAEYLGYADKADITVEKPIKAIVEIKVFKADGSPMKDDDNFKANEILNFEAVTTELEQSEMDTIKWTALPDAISWASGSKGIAVAGKVKEVADSGDVVVKATLTSADGNIERTKIIKVCKAGTE